MIAGFFAGVLLVRPAAAQAVGGNGDASLAARGAAEASMMPLPRHYSAESEGFALARLRTVASLIANGTSDDERLQSALERLNERWRARVGAEFKSPTTSARGGRGDLTILVSSRAQSQDWRQDEYYTLRVSADGVELKANTVVGALRGLATLTQLLEQDASGRWVIAPAQIEDSPRFPWRGLLIDVGRHFEPVVVIERELDGMELVKLNVLHFHLTEDQGFRIQSLTHPELTRLGSDGQFYTQDQMRHLIHYAWLRGIRVMPEFDMPGHVTALAVSHPELVSAPGPFKIERQWGVFNPVLDPTNPALYPFLDEFLGEMAALFPDPFLHVGGDENNGVQWNANPRIQAFIRDHHLDGDPGLQTYFEQHVSDILIRHRKRMVGWDEILQPGLPLNSVIESWRGADGVAAAAKAGHDVILAHGYYIDLCRPASEHYANDPLPADSGLNAQEAAHVLGGEATMWGERVGPGSIDTRIWPRTAAIAERLWSAADVRDPADMYRRLDIIDLRLAEAGLKDRSDPFQIAQRLVRPAPASVAQAVATLASALSPVEDYKRGSVQPEMDQYHPLTTMADVAVPDSQAARDFNREAAAYAATPGAQLRAQLADALHRWRDASVVALAFGQRARQRDVAAAASQVLDACERSLSALGFPADNLPPLAPMDDPHTGTFLAIAPGVKALSHS